MILFKKRRKRLTTLVQELSPTTNERRVYFSAQGVFALLDASIVRPAARKNIQELKVMCLRAVDDARIQQMEEATGEFTFPFPSLSSKHLLAPRLLILSSEVFIDAGDLAEYYFARNELALATLVRHRIAECAFALEVATLSSAQ